MNKALRIGLIFSLFLLLVLFRTLAPRLLYDPFIDYFRDDYLTASFPSYDSLNLFLGLLLRYTINALISVGIIFVFYLNRAWVVFSIKFYVIAFVVLSICYFVLLKTEFSNGYLMPFYIRRMLIHPIFLLVLLPAFYYQKLSKREV